MKIQNVRIENPDGRTRLIAQVVWEDSERPSCDVFFETESAFGDAFAAFPDAFLAASLTPALWAGEKRIFVEGEVCPELLENVGVVRRVFQHWFKHPKNLAEIEARPRAQSFETVSPRRAAFFFSGGLDSLAALRVNRLNVPRDHPASLKDGIIVHGLEVEQEQPFKYVIQALTELAREADISLVPVSTNVRVLNPDWAFWWNAHMGPALCAVAHALGRRFSSVTIGSDYDLPHLKQHGSHPLVEPNFSSYSLKVKYHGLTMSRVDKARLVSEWAPALRHMRVCNKPDLYRPGNLNCGECEKCIRTLLELLAAGTLDRADGFQRRELSPEIISRLYMPIMVQSFYEELVEPLKTVGRSDLSAALQSALKRARGENGLTGRLRKFDRDHLNGSLRSLKQAMASPSS